MHYVNGIGKVLERRQGSIEYARLVRIEWKSISADARSCAARDGGRTSGFQIRCTSVHVVIQQMIDSEARTSAALSPQLQTRLLIPTRTLRGTLRGASFRLPAEMPATHAKDWLQTRLVRCSRCS